MLAVLLGPGSYLVAKGVLSADQANTLLPAIVTIATVGGGSVIAWFGQQSHSAPAVVAAVNSDSVPGVKAVASSSPSLEVSVNKDGKVIPQPPKS